MPADANPLRTMSGSSSPIWLKKAFPSAAIPAALIVVFDDRIQFLHHEQPVDRVGELSDPLHGQGVADTELQHPSVGEHLTHVLVGDARGDHTEVGAGS